MNSKPTRRTFFVGAGATLAAPVGITAALASYGEGSGDRAALLAALDTACGYAALTLMPARAEVLTVELKSNLLAPVRSGTVKARGEVLRAGRVLTVCPGDAFQVVGDEATHVATMLATMITRDEDHAAPSLS